MACMKVFDLSSPQPELTWMNKPKTLEYSDDGLRVTPDKETDFWQKTYYDPLLVADNGHFLYQDVDSKTMIETVFHLKEGGQFDHVKAGLMVRKDGECWIKTVFDLSSPQPELTWMNKPKTLEYSDDGLRVTPDKETDFWQKTYYDPLLVADNGHFLYQDVDSKTMIETVFHLKEGGQFDQAGLMVRKDGECWIKTGIEHVDGGNKLSVVVTNGFSDWSTQRHASGDLPIRIYRQGACFVIEVKFGEHWEFIRICHLNIDEKAPVKMGLFTCSPKDFGGKVTFDYLKYDKCDKYHHNAE